MFVYLSFIVVVVFPLYDCEKCWCHWLGWKPYNWEENKHPDCLLVSSESISISWETSQTPTVSRDIFGLIVVSLRQSCLYVTHRRWFSDTLLADFSCWRVGFFFCFFIANECWPTCILAQTVNLTSKTQTLHTVSQNDLIHQKHWH